MRREIPIFLLLPAIVLTAGSISAQESPANGEHLKFLDPLVGNWRVVTHEAEKIVSDGQEASEWILNKSFVRSTGWSQFRGESAQYEFYTGWDPKTKEVFQWAVGATDSLYAIMRRTGSHDAIERLWSSRNQTALSDGGQETTRVNIKFVHHDKITIDFLERRLGDEVLPEQHDTFTRAEIVAAPAFDSTPGPGYEQIKFLDFSIGKWKLEAELPEGPYVGEEVNEWFLDKNFIRTKGWGKIADQERVDYELLTGWDPAAKKVVMWYVGSDGQFATREGDYDAEKSCLRSTHRGVDAAGVESTATVVEQYVDNDCFLLKFTDVSKGGTPQPDMEGKATRIRP